MALRELNAQLEREAGRGRMWACASLQSGGYPLAIFIDCETPRLRIEEQGRTRTFIAQHAVVRAQLYAPTLVEIDLTGPATFTTSETEVSAEWSTLRIDLRGLPLRLDRLSVVGTDVAADIAGFPRIKVETLHAHLKRTAPIAMAPFGLTLGLAGIDSPALMNLGKSGPALLTVLGTITQVDAAGVGHWSERLDAWRNSGGRVAISALSLARGDASLQGEGQLGLDQQHRLDGKLALRLRNAGPALLALAEETGKLQRNSLSGQLAAGILGRPGELKFDLAAENGSLSVGPLRRLFALPPLY